MFLNKHVKSREYSWERSDITPEKRAIKYEHKSVLVIFAGKGSTGKINIAKALEKKLFKLGKFVYFLGISNELLLSGSGSNDKVLERMRHIQQLGEMSHVLTDAGLILITSISDIDQYELNTLKSLNRPSKTFIVNVGERAFPDGYVDLEIAADEDALKAADKIADALVRSTLPDPEFSI